MLGLGHRSVHIWNCCGEVMASFFGYYKRGGGGTKLNASLAIQQRTDLFEVNISANKISLLQGQSYTEKEYYNGF